LTVEFRNTSGFLVADSSGHRVGRVEGPMYGTAPDVPDALAVRSGGLLRHHFVVHADAINEIDARRRVVRLLLEEDRLQRFL
jgi:uncharacterized protein YrrD